MIKIFKYSFKDLLRSRWSVIYFLFFLASTFALLYLSDNLNKAIVSLMNVAIAIIPLISTVFGVMHFYNSKEFVELLLSQPIKRRAVFFGQYFGLTVSLSLGFVLGTIIPFIVYGLTDSAEVWNFSILLLAGSFLTFIFVALSFFISLLNEDKIKGFGFAILAWLYFGVIYDGFMLLFFIGFSDYPMDRPAMVMTILNPIDLARVFVLLKLDISALMGYTGAVFNTFFGTAKGMLFSFATMCFWIALPLFGLSRLAQKKDF